jgi:hypothetical protein
MKLPQESTEAKGHRDEDRVPKVPTHSGKWGAIWATMVDARKDGQHEVYQSKDAEGDGEDDSDRFVNREKEYY